MSTPIPSDPVSPTLPTGDDSRAPESPQPDVTAAMDPAVKTIQPGGGVVMSIELAWGKVRRRLLRTFRPGYVRRMLATRRGDRGDLPLDPVDPRDLKYYRNQETYYWDEADDPFRWRDSLPFVRAGLAELLLIGGGCLLLAAAVGYLWWPLSLAPLTVAGLVIWFFRNPTRIAPPVAAAVVSPADGKLVQIERLEDPDLGKCVQIGIFLSIFNVHANRASLPGQVVAIRYRPGKFLNALRPESAKENENLDVVIESDELSGRRYRIRQITGQFARRIVCWSRPGQQLQRGEMFGMIKLGSRTELVIPDHPDLELKAQIGDKVLAGTTILAQYQNLGETERQPS